MGQLGPTGICFLGDVIERAALSYWKQLCQQSAQGRCHDMLLLFHDIGILEDMGGREAILIWDAATAKDWKAEFQNRCRTKAENDVQQPLQNGKHNFFTTIMPFFDAPGPLDISLGDTGGRCRHIAWRWKLVDTIANLG